MDPSCVHTATPSHLVLALRTVDCGAAVRSEVSGYKVSNCTPNTARATRFTYSLTGTSGTNLWAVVAAKGVLQCSSASVAVVVVVELVLLDSNNSMQGGQSTSIDSTVRDTRACRELQCWLCGAIATGIVCVDGVRRRPMT